MAANKKNIFRKESLDRIDSLEKIDQYIKVSKISIWLFILGCSIAVLALLIWGFIGTLPKTIFSKGISTSNGLVITYIDPSELPQNLLNCPVKIELPDDSSVQGTVIAVSDIPYSLKEVREKFKRDWVVKQIFSTSYAYQVDISSNTIIPEDVIVTTVITYDEIRPIEYLLN